MAQYQGSDWQLQVDQERIDITSDRPTPNERWRFTDANGHEHHYERGYPTLDFVIDAEHWCDGHEGIYNHDPHMAIDEAHYECLICRVVVEPLMDPPYTPKSMPGRVSATLTGTRQDGSRITAFVTKDQFAALQSAEDTDTAGQALVDSIPEDQIIERNVASR